LQQPDELTAGTRLFRAKYVSWSMNEVEKTLVRQYEESLVPNFEGRKQKSSVTLAGMN